jgi:hypothetical protein
MRSFSPGLPGLRGKTKVRLTTVEAYSRILMYQELTLTSTVTSGVATATLP